MQVRRIGRRDFAFDRKVAVMAVVNRTPDSFYDQGATFALDAAVGAALNAVAAGADWVDIGGVPFGRGPEVSPDEEIAAIGLPALAAVSNKDFIGEAIGRDQGLRLPASLAAMVVCIMKGARIVRMHDVFETVDAVRMTEAILGMRAPTRFEHNTHPTHNV